jgi:hypothetical protein
MKLIFSTLLILISALSLKAQLWKTEIIPYIIPLPPVNYESELKGYDIQETNDGNYVFAGNHRYGLSSNYSYTPFLTKLDASTGNTLWQKEYPIFNDGNLQEVSLVEKTNGNLLMAGINYNEIFLIETDAMGDTIKTSTYLSTCAMLNNIDCNLHTIRLRATNDGNYIIGAGSTGGFIGLPTPMNDLFKISPNHSVLWQKTYDKRFLLDFQPTSDGGYIMSGSTTISQAILFKVDANGDSLWQQPYTNIPVYDLNSVKETPDHGFVVAGYTSGFAGTNPYLFKLDSIGTTESWSLTLGSEEGTAKHVIVDPNGNYVVTGTKQVAHGGGFLVMLPAAFVTKVSPSGTILQDQIFDNLIDNSSRAVRYTSDGNFVIAGSHGLGMGDQNRGYVVKTGYTLSAVDVEESTEVISVFPNPFQAETIISIEEGNYNQLQLEVYDALGRSINVVYSEDTKRIVLSKGNLEAGVYWFRLLGDDKVVGTGKLVVQ